MISLLLGTVQEKRKHSLIVGTTGGVGYEVHMAPLRLSSYGVGEPVTIYTYLKVSDSALDLYGFAASEERNFFTLLMSVSGIGPKTAMNILSLGSIHKIENAIARGDISYLTGVQGMGKKTAERLVVELKSKMGLRSADSGSAQSSDVLAEVIEALVDMGYARDEARQKVESVASDGKTTEQLLKAALRAMKGRP